VWQHTQLVTNVPGRSRDLLPADLHRILLSVCPESLSAVDCMYAPAVNPPMHPASTPSTLPNSTPPPGGCSGQPACPHAQLGIPETAVTSCLTSSSTHSLTSNIGFGALFYDGEFSHRPDPEPGDGDGRRVESGAAHAKFGGRHSWGAVQVSPTRAHSNRWNATSSPSRAVAWQTLSRWRASGPYIPCYATRTPPSVCATSLPSAPESLHARPTRELAGLCAHRRSYFIEGSPNRRVIVSRGVVNEVNDKFFRQVRPPVCWHRTATGLIGGGPLTVRVVLCSTGIGPTTCTTRTGTTSSGRWRSSR
jgi:hypothetical protein